MISPAQEEQVCDALANLGWLENDHALHMEGIRAIQEVLECSVEEARAVLGDLRTRNLIDITVTPGGALNADQSEPLAQLRWIRGRERHVPQAMP